MTMPPSQICVAHTETPDDGEVDATAEPPGTGVASVSFECAGIPGPFEITATVGTVDSNAIVGNCVGMGATVEVDSFGTTITGDEGVPNVPKDIVLGQDSKGTGGTANDEVYVVGRVLDAAGQEVANAELTFVVTNSAGESQSLFVAGADGAEAMGGLPTAPGDSGCTAGGDKCVGMTKSGAGIDGGVAHVGVIDFDDDTLVKDTFTITATCTTGCVDPMPSDTDEFVTAGPVVDITVDGPANIDVDMDAVYTASGWDLDGDPVADGTAAFWISTSSRILFRTDTVAFKGFPATMLSRPTRLVAVP